MLENVQDPEKTSELLSQKEISSMKMSLLGSMSRLVTNYVHLQINKNVNWNFLKSQKFLRCF